MLSALLGVLRDGFREAVMAHDIPELCKFLILDHCQRRLLCTHKEVDLVRYPFVCRVLQVGDAEKFPQVVSL